MNAQPTVVLLLMITGTGAVGRGNGLYFIVLERRRQNYSPEQKKAPDISWQKKIVEHTVLVLSDRQLGGEFGMVVEMRYNVIGKL